MPLKARTAHRRDWDRSCGPGRYCDAKPSSTKQEADDRSYWTPDLRARSPNFQILQTSGAHHGCCEAATATGQLAHGNENFCERSPGSTAVFYPLAWASSCKFLSLAWANSSVAIHRLIAPAWKALALAAGGFRHMKQAQTHRNHGIREIRAQYSGTEGLSV